MQRTWFFVAVLVAAITFPSASLAGSNDPPAYEGTLTYTDGGPESVFIDEGGGGSGCRYVEPMYSERAWSTNSGYDFGVGLHWCWSGGRITQCSTRPIVSAWGYWRWTGSLYGPYEIRTDTVCGFDWIGSFTYATPWSADQYRVHTLSPRGYSNGTSR